MTHHGDLFDVLPTLAEASIDACVTDPPYDLTANKKGGSGKASVNLDSPYGRSRISTGNGSGGFMGQKWDGEGVAFRPETWREVLRVLKPGAHLVAFGGPRTFHRMTSAIEDAGFEIRDCLSWLYGSGFPKSLNLGDGRGTALKPGWEPAVLARKPMRQTVAANVAEFGTGTINIDAARIGDNPGWAYPNGRGGEGWHGRESLSKNLSEPIESTLGRWPANVCLDEAAAAMLDEQSGDVTQVSLRLNKGRGIGFGSTANAERGVVGYTDIGGASRFFYVAKPSRAEREEGIYDLEPRQRDDSRKDGNPGGDNPRNRGLSKRGNFHPTVKPVELMRWLVRLVTPVGGTVLDPFMGSGTTGMACAYELRPFIGIEREADYIQIAERRIASCVPLFNQSEQSA